MIPLVSTKERRKYLEGYNFGKRFKRTQQGKL